MQKISTKMNCEPIRGLPPPVHHKIEETVAMLNFYYGENREIDKDLGGYVLLVENKEDIEKLKNIFSENIQNVIPEFCDILAWQGKVCYTSSLILISSDFSVTLIIPYELTPTSFLKYTGGNNDR